MKKVHSRGKMFVFIKERTDLDFGFSNFSTFNSKRKKISFFFFFFDDYFEILTRPRGKSILPFVLYNLEKCFIISKLLFLLVTVVSLCNTKSNNTSLSRFLSVFLLIVSNKNYIKTKFCAELYCNRLNVAACRAPTK